MPLPRWSLTAKTLLIGIPVAAFLWLILSLTQWDGIDVAAGRQFAERNCARCHAVGPTGNSPFPPAPAFRTFAKSWPLESLEEALAEGIVVGHSDMPEFQLTPAQIGDFIGYLETIQQP